MGEANDNDKLMRAIRMGNPVFWQNPHYACNDGTHFSTALIDDAEARLQRFAPFIAVAFPETAEARGLIESPLVEIPEMKERIECAFDSRLEGRLFLKRDDLLPISGSIKARGGIYEVLKYAEELALASGMLSQSDDYSVLREEKFQELFSTHSVAVGSTGNLGLSIGIISAILGFKVSVHMSTDARQWKKDLLRSKCVNVVEYEGDYCMAVEGGRRLAAADPACHFVDDEKSVDLFLGYAVAAHRLKKQLDLAGIIIDMEHPLCVYLPCGVGGGPGGITLGLKQIYSSAVRCYFAEPVMSPCMLLGLMSGKWENSSVFDYGLSGKTEADGLAVARPSHLVCQEMDTLLDGCFTVRDTELFVYLRELHDFEHMSIEPSACAGFAGVRRAGQDASNVTHLVWSTGGGMVPEDEMLKYL